jgi:hypothetical protein
VPIWSLSAMSPTRSIFSGGAAATARTGDPASSSCHIPQSMNMKSKPLSTLIALSVLGLMTSAASFAHSKAHLDAGAGNALTHFYALNPANRKLVDRAAGVLVFSRVTKGGAGVAGEFGEGVLRVKGETVNYYSVGSASVGLTLGVARHSEIILFMTQESRARALRMIGMHGPLEPHRRELRVFY